MNLVGNGRWITSSADLRQYLLADCIGDLFNKSICYGFAYQFKIYAMGVLLLENGQNIEMRAKEFRDIFRTIK